MHSILRLNTTVIATFRLIGAHRAHTKWRRSRGSSLDPGEPKFVARRNTSTREDVTHPRSQGPSMKERKQPEDSASLRLRLRFLSIIEEQRTLFGKCRGRIFPYDGKSVGAAFRRQCRELKIEDLHFHALRHEGTSRLFEAGVCFSAGRVGYRLQKCCGGALMSFVTASSLAAYVIGRALTEK